MYFCINVDFESSKKTLQITGVSVNLTQLVIVMGSYKKKEASRNI
jgi:hypothetical protein